MVMVSVGLQTRHVSILGVNCIQQAAQKNYASRRVFLLWVRLRPHLEYSALSWQIFSPTSLVGMNHRRPCIDHCTTLNSV